MDGKFKIVICDDDSQFLDELYKQVCEILSDINCTHNITKLYSGAELLEHCKKNIADIVLVDIDMPGITGFEAVRELQKCQPELPIIFVTAHEEYAFQAYDYQPFWFVSKRKLEKLKNVLIKLIDKIEFRKKAHETVYIQCDNQTVSINVEQVMYIKSSGHYLIQYTSRGESLKFRCGLQDAYVLLKSAGFICAHRSYIVNCRYINKINTKGVFLKNGDKLPVSGIKSVIEEAQNLHRQFSRRTRW